MSPRIIAAAFLAALPFVLMMLSFSISVLSSSYLSRVGFGTFLSRFMEKPPTSSQEVRHARTVMLMRELSNGRSGAATPEK